MKDKDNKNKENKSIIGRVILLIIVILASLIGICLLFYRNELEADYIISRLTENIVTAIIRDGTIARISEP